MAGGETLRRASPRRTHFLRLLIDLRRGQERNRGALQRADQIVQDGFPAAQVREPGMDAGNHCWRGSMGHGDMRVLEVPRHYKRNEYDDVVVAYPGAAVSEAILTY